MDQGEGVEGADLKEDPLDFALWKAWKEGEDTSWDAPWGRGRPGWHIECSAMAEALLGVEFDIHGGGIDLVFPHHENEAAQTLAARGEPLARIWMHNGMLELGAEKMAKSVGNIRGLGEVLDEVGAEVLVLFMSTGHYRQPLAFSDEALEDARRSAARIREAGRRLVAGPSPDGAGVLPRRVLRRAAQRLQHGRGAGLAVRLGPRGEPLRGAGRRRAPGEMLDVLGLVGAARRRGGRAAEEAVELAERARRRARATRTGPRPIACATSCARMGWEVRDGPDGPELVPRVMSPRSGRAAAARAAPRGAGPAVARAGAGGGGAAAAAGGGGARRRRAAARGAAERRVAAAAAAAARRRRSAAARRRRRRRWRRGGGGGRAAAVRGGGGGGRVAAAARRRRRGGRGGGAARAAARRGRLAAARGGGRGGGVLGGGARRRRAWAAASGGGSRRRGGDARRRLARRRGAAVRRGGAARGGARVAAPAGGGGSGGGGRASWRRAARPWRLARRRRARRRRAAAASRGGGPGVRPPRRPGAARAARAPGDYAPAHVPEGAVTSRRMVIYGRNPVREALRGRRKVHRIWATRVGGRGLGAARR